MKLINKIKDTLFPGIDMERHERALKKIAELENELSDARRGQTNRWGHPWCEIVGKLYHRRSKLQVEYYRSDANNRILESRIKELEAKLQKLNLELDQKIDRIKELEESQKQTLSFSVDASAYLDSLIKIIENYERLGVKLIKPGVPINPMPEVIFLRVESAKVKDIAKLIQQCSYFEEVSNDVN